MWLNKQEGPLTFLFRIALKKGQKLPLLAAPDQN
jgi:hypothetical protein